MRVATWNVNSIRQRLDHLLAWLQERSPDVVCLQEIKCTDDAFPREPRQTSLRLLSSGLADLIARSLLIVITGLVPVISLMDALPS